MIGSAMNAAIVSGPWAMIMASRASASSQGTWGKSSRMPS
jgi:hypothetical protein